MDVQTAKTPGRKDFEAMVAFFRKQSKLPPSNEKCLTALVEKTDRFYRNATDMVAIRDVGATTHLIKEGMVIGPNSSCHEKFVHGMNVIMAERVVDNLSEETKKGMLEKAQQGIWPSFAPMGYSTSRGLIRSASSSRIRTLAPLVRLSERQVSHSNTPTDTSREKRFHRKAFLVTRLLCQHCRDG